MHPARLVAGLVLGLAVAAGAARPLAQSDLDPFMRQVMARRDDNWKKLQQYVLDERETFELKGPGATTLWGERRDYTWFIRDGFFVRSPLKVNGAAVSDNDRRTFEEQFLRRERRRDARANRGREDRVPAAEPPAADDDTPLDLSGVIAQTQQPGFVSSAYFLRFSFDEGRYALVGREHLEDRDVLRIEYYPTKLFADERRRRQLQQGGDAQARERNDAMVSEMRRLMNKTSKVTLWVEPESHQILKYTFDDLGWDFLPAAWMLRVSDVTASMSMGQPFPDVWLPRGLTMDIAMTFALGSVNYHYALDYHDYRRADVTTKVGVAAPR